MITFENVTKKYDEDSGTDFVNGIIIDRDLTIWKWNNTKWKQNGKNI